MIKKHLSICPIVNGKHLHPYKCCCEVIQLAKKKIMEHIIFSCKHSEVTICWICREVIEQLYVYEFEEEYDTV